MFDLTAGQVTYDEVDNQAAENGNSVSIHAVVLAWLSQAIAMVVGAGGDAKWNE
jgi:hypothetical protein